MLEVGAGAAQCSRWLAAQGARPVALDLSHRQLQHALRIDARRRRPAVAAGRGRRGARCPSRDGSFDLACSAYGAVPFVADPVRVMREVRRVLRPGGRWVFSVTHPMRWAFPDEPGPEGLTRRRPRTSTAPLTWSRTSRGAPSTWSTTGPSATGYGTWWPAGFRLIDLVEPEWPAWNTQEWGGWSPLRGGLIPGTAIFVCERD